MDTKYSHTHSLLTEKTHPLIEFFFEFAQLKNLYRQGWLKRGMPKSDCETAADHTLGVAILAYVLAVEYRPDLDPYKVMQLGVFHELGEVGPGDFTPEDNVSLEDKFQLEYKAVQELFSRMPNPEKYINIWLEFEKETTPEATFVKQIDKLEMALQAHLYKRLGHTNLDEFFPYVRERIKSPELKLVIEEIIRVNGT